jgi:DivIVA domain-containing protein
VDVTALDRVRFSPALRGYRMDEVDDVLDRVTEELRVRDAEIARLREELARRDAPAVAPEGDRR